jgi:hypothetical protein
MARYFIGPPRRLGEASKEELEVTLGAGKLSNRARQSSIVASVILNLVELTAILNAHPLTATQAREAV